MQSPGERVRTSHVPEWGFVCSCLTRIRADGGYFPFIGPSLWPCVRSCMNGAMLFSMMPPGVLIEQRETTSQTGVRDEETSWHLQNPLKDLGSCEALLDSKCSICASVKHAEYAIFSLLDYGELIIGPQESYIHHYNSFSPLWESKGATSFAQTASLLRKP